MSIIDHIASLTARIGGEFKTVRGELLGVASDRYTKSETESAVAAASLAFSTSIISGGTPGAPVDANFTATFESAL